MGALESATKILSGVTGVLGAFDEISSSFSNQGAAVARQQYDAQQQLALQQLQQQQSLDMAQAAHDAELQRQQLAFTEQNAEETRQRALKRAVASQRAKFGSSGTGSTGGSGEAVLLGLFEESDEERQQRERLSQLKSSALDADLAHQSSINVLQSSQLKQKQQLDRAIKFGG